MSKAMTQVWRRLRSGQGVLREHQQGQSLVIIAFAFIGILAIVGLGFDLGWAYVESIRVGQAADAAALAAASELPLEETSHTRALVYLQENGYDYSVAEDVRLVVDGAPISGPSEQDALTTIWIATSYSRDASLPAAQQVNTADRIRVTVKQRVPMHFMQFIGFRTIPVQASAEAENISNIDTVIVYDKSGSMEYDTLCYGCWEQSDDQYPNGYIYPLPWSDHTIASADHCANTCDESDYHYYDGTYDVSDCNYRHRTYTDTTYTVIEAEEYSGVSVPYETWGYTPHYTFWVMQRNEYNDYHGRDVGAMGRDSRGAYLSHHPYAEYRSGSGLGVACTWDDLNDGEICRRDPDNIKAGPFPAPRADYGFYAPRGDHYYVWIRGQGGNSSGNQHIFWGIDGGVQGQESGFPTGAYYDGARNDRWSWRRLSKGEGGNQGDSVYLPAGNHTLHLWAGGAGFDVDRIVVTTSSSSYLPSSIQGAPANNGRTGGACSPCDPRFAGRPGGQAPPDGEYRPDCSLGGSPDQRQNAIYDDEQPIRNALEAARHFVSRMNPRFDQVGYVPYSTSATIGEELQCVRRLGPDDCTSQVLTDTVLYDLDRTRAGGNTNIAYGMDLGIDVLSTAGSHYGRPGAAHVMVLMTDGEANTYTNCDSSCNDEDLWPDGEAAKDCVVWYSRQARNNAIVVYTISLGWSADAELMEYVAELTGGYSRSAKPATPEKLDEIFDELYERIFLRLVD
jgi:Flp pilus assembly protein TadG